MFGYVCEQFVFYCADVFDHCCVLVVVFGCDVHDLRVVVVGVWCAGDEVFGFECVEHVDQVCFVVFDCGC